jgi:hypothetical protein
MRHAVAPGFSQVTFGFEFVHGSGPRRVSCPKQLATFLPRLGVTPRGRNAADGGRLKANCDEGLISVFRWPSFADLNSLADSKRSGINSAQRA